MVAAGLLAFAATAVRCRERRRQQVQERCYHSYTLLLGSLRRWQAATHEQRLARLKLRHAEAHWRRRALACALAAWRQRVLEGEQRQRALARAQAHVERRALRRALGALRAAAADGEGRRLAACLRLEVWAARCSAARASHALRLWLWLARRRAQLEQAEAAVAESSARLCIAAALRGWASQVRHARRMEQGHAAMAAAGRRWAARLAVARWRLVVEAMQGLRTRELRERVATGACLG